MDRDIGTLREAALSLDSEGRAALMNDLAISLAEEPAFLEEWLSEADRRWKSIQSGEVKPRTGEEMISEARKRIRR